VTNLEKVYRIGLQEEKSETVMGTIGNLLKAPLKNFRNVKNLSSFKDEGKDKFYALSDVSFDVRHGEALAIIGKNGAGKSTLLKIISRITEPSGGKIEIFGRISSLLEVGTGFHPDLTGRENVYLNGTILGMRKSEIDKKFDEIVEFSGIHKFIDTQTKRYSSGMRIRLAFSVAAHLEAEILLIDEVLAVGDVEFQKKCLGKMNEVTGQGRTVLFVSHNMGAVQELCSRGIVLSNGQKVFDGSINESINHYLDEMKNPSSELSSKHERLSLGSLMINDKLNASLTPGETINVQLPIRANNLENPWIIFIIEDLLGQNIVNLSLKSRELGYEIIDGEQTIELNFPSLWLAPGMYSAYFKILLQEPGKKSGKLETERHLFEIDGDEEIIRSGFHSGKKATVLAPHVKWNFIK
jgi:lipopolysaccharide transport system ATP-binding protein